MSYYKHKDKKKKQEYFSSLLHKDKLFFIVLHMYCVQISCKNIFTQYVCRLQDKKYLVFIQFVMKIYIFFLYLFQFVNLVHKMREIFGIITFMQ